MAVPHVCPKCNGHKKVLQVFGFNGSSGIGTGSMVDCPVCDATGIVWETTLADVCTPSSGLDYNAPQSTTVPRR